MMSIDLLGVSSLQAQVKVSQAHFEENQRLNDLLSVRDEELNKLEESVSVLRQQVQGQFLFTDYVVKAFICTFVSNLSLSFICICHLI